MHSFFCVVFVRFVGINELYVMVSVWSFQIWIAVHFLLFTFFFSPFLTIIPLIKSVAVESSSIGGFVWLYTMCTMDECTPWRLWCVLPSCFLTFFVILLVPPLVCQCCTYWSWFGLLIFDHRWVLSTYCVPLSILKCILSQLCVVRSLVFWTCLNGKYIIWLIHFVFGRWAKYYILMLISKAVQTVFHKLDEL